MGKPGPLTAWFKGDVDEVRIWDHIRTETEIQDYKDRAVDGSTPGLLARWALDEGVGSANRR